MASLNRHALRHAKNRQSLICGSCAANTSACTWYDTANLQAETVARDSGTGSAGLSSGALWRQFTKVRRGGGAWCSRTRRRHHALKSKLSIQRITGWCKRSLSAALQPPQRAGGGGYPAAADSAQMEVFDWLTQRKDTRVSATRVVSGEFHQSTITRRRQALSGGRVGNGPSSPSPRDPRSHRKHGDKRHARNYYANKQSNNTGTRTEAERGRGAGSGAQAGKV